MFMPAVPYLYWKIKDPGTEATGAGLNAETKDYED
jgi:hypothetical protein